MLAEIVTLAAPREADGSGAMMDGWRRLYTTCSRSRFIEENTPQSLSGFAKKDFIENVIIIITAIITTTTVVIIKLIIGAAEASEHGGRGWDGGGWMTDISSG